MPLAKVDIEGQPIHIYLVRDKTMVAADSPPGDVGLLEIFICECFYWGCKSGTAKDGALCRGRFSLTRDEMERPNAKKYCSEQCRYAMRTYTNKLKYLSVDPSQSGDRVSTI